MAMPERRLRSVPNGDSEATTPHAGGRPLRSPHAPSTSTPGSSWDGAEGERYNPREFYVNSTDKKVAGDSTVVSIRFPTGVKAEIDRLIATGALAGTPIDGFSAFARDAVVHRMHTVAVLVNDPLLMAAAEDQRRLAQIESMRSEQQAKQRIVDEARDSFAAGRAANDKHYVEALAQRYELIAENLREPYATQLGDTLKDARKWLKTSKSS